MGLDQVTSPHLPLPITFSSHLISLIRLQDIREVYNFICTNYVEGDEIFLIGFSRGAFTARSTADMIASLGILTPDGLDRFYSVFNDYMYMGTPSRNKTEFIVPDLPEYKGQKGQEKNEWEAERTRIYREKLIELGYTRDKFRDEKTDITIKALGVWDTVGALGIPPAPVIGVRGSSNQWAFTNTQISDKVEHAFQALALDEPRYAFRPALWERMPGSKTNLKQCWFPGTHANVGGGWYDQQIADITLACEFSFSVVWSHTDCQPRDVRPTLDSRSRVQPHKDALHLPRLSPLLRRPPLPLLTTFVRSVPSHQG